MIKPFARWMFQLPIRWKMSMVASLLLCILFLLYNAAQYLILQHWTTRQEQSLISKKEDEIQGYFLDKNNLDISDSKTFLDKANARNEMIRILDGNGKPLLTVSDDFPDSRLLPVPVTQRQLTFQEHLVVLRSPLRAGTFTGTLEIADDMETFDKLTDIVALVMFLGGIGAVIISGLGGFLLSGQLIKPLTAITDTMQRIKRNGLKERVVFPENKDEFSRLALMFNELMDSLEQSFRQQQQFVEDASHELRTPVAIIEGHLQLLERWGKHEPTVLDESLHASIQELNRLKGLVQELLALSRAESLDSNAVMEHANAQQVIREVVSDFSLLYPDAQLYLEENNTADEQLAITPYHFKQILMILIENALKYSGEKKLVRIRSSRRSSDKVDIHIEDRGIGIPAHELPYVFDRFYRVDKARSRKMGGSGLGLAIAKRLVEKYHGNIDIASKERCGTTVTIRIPFVPNELGMEGEE